MAVRLLRLLHLGLQETLHRGAAHEATVIHPDARPLSSRESSSAAVVARAADLALDSIEPRRRRSDLALHHEWQS